MAGNDPTEAEQNFLVPLAFALSCVTHGELRAGQGNEGDTRAVFLNPGSHGELDSPHNLGLEVTQWYEIVEAPGDRGPYKVSTRAWFYNVIDLAAGPDDDDRVLAYHWHPATPSWPHLHLRSELVPGSGNNLPTGRIALEQVIRYLIEHLEVVPQRPDWAEVLDDTQGKFEQFRMWHGQGPS